LSATGIQKSAYRSSDEIRFTVNLSVISRAEWARQSAVQPYLGKRPTPTVQYGPWADQVRIGQLTPSGEDKWWRIIRGADVDPVRIDALSAAQPSRRSDALALWTISSRLT
jgi:hypothetical protein